MYRILLTCLLTALALAGCLRLDQPTDVKATALNDSTVVVTWKDWAKYEDGYLIEEHHGSTPFATTSRTSADSERVEITGRKSGETYQYRVSAFKGKEQSRYSQVVEVTLPNPPPSEIVAAEAPMGLFAKALSVTQTELTWVDCSESEQGFEIERSESSGDQWTKAGDVGTNITKFIDKDLTPGKRYSYRVRSMGVAGPSDYSNQSSTVTPLTKTIRVIYPNGGEVIKGPELIVRFEGDPSLGGVKIYFFTDQKFWYKAANWAQNSGVFVFRDFNSLIASKRYKIRISGSDPTFYDESDGFFEVISNTH